MTPREWRERQGLTQEEVGKIINRTKGYVSLLESKERVPSFEVLKAYQKASKGSVNFESFR